MTVKVVGLSLVFKKGRIQAWANSEWVELHLVKEFPTNYIIAIL